MGTALDPQDYAGLSSQTLTFAAGETSKTVSVSTLDDTIFEGATPETMFLNLSNAVNATIADNQGQGNIIDNDVQPTISISDATVTEGGNLVFTISLSNASYQAVTVDYITAMGTALDPQDYAGLSSQTLTFAAGETSKTISVSTLDDTIFEGATPETMFLNLSNAVNATIADNQGQGNIVDNDAQPTISISDATVTEGGNLVFTISLSNPSYQAVTVDYVTAMGTALDPQDYAGLSSQTLTFAAGETSKTISVSTLDDTIFEGATPETMFLNLSNAVNSTIADNQGQGNIVDNDAQPTISISDATVTEGGNLVFTISLSNASYQDVTVDYVTAMGSALDPQDYAGLSSQTLTFAAGETSKTISVSTLDDTIFEGATPETMFLNLSNAVNATIADNQGQGNIVDNDVQPTISISDATIVEGGNLVFTISLSNASYQAVTVDYVTAMGTALDPQDYAGLSSQTLTFAAGETSKTVSVSTLDDTIFEGATPETMFLNLSNAVNATIADNQGQGNIVDNDAQPTISISDATIVTEGGNLVFTISLSNPSYQAVTVDYVTAMGTALDPQDYAGLSSQTLTFAAGETSKTISVSTLDDTIFEGATPETMFLNLSNAVNATIADNQGQGNIVDNDAQPTISISDATIVTEGGNLVFTISLSNASYQAVTVDYVTAMGTALDPQDYAGLSSQTLTFAAGETSKTISVSTLDDTIFEGATPETMFLNLSNAVNATIADNQGQGNIVDNDAQPTISISDATVTEGGNLVFTISLSNASYQAVTVDYVTAMGTALDPQDYAGLSSQTLTFAAGETSKTISVSTLDDTIFEGATPETMFLNLSNAVNATIADNQGQGNIVDNDAQPTISISDATVTEGGNLVFTISLSNASYQAVTVDYVTAMGTALDPQDYAGLSSQTLTFAAGETSKTISVSTLDDTIFEGATPETMFLNLSNAVNSTIADNQGQGNIVDNDVQPTISISDATVTEGGNLVFTISLSNASYQAVTVDYVTAMGTALDPQDYAGLSSQTLTFAAGETSKTISVSTLDDTIFEGATPETMFLNLSNAVNATIADNQGQGNIVDNDAQPTISISDATVTEGGNLVFTISLSNASYQDVTVDYVTAMGTALDPQDYAGLSSQTLTFAAGETSKTFQSLH